MKICSINELSDAVFAVDYHYSLKNFNDIPFSRIARFTSRRGERPWSRLMYILEGSAVISFDGGSLEVCRADCVAIPADAEFTLEWISPGAKGTVSSLIMAFSLYDESFGRIELCSVPTKLSTENGKYIHRLFAESVAEYSRGGSSAKLRCKSLLLELFYSLSHVQNEIHSHHDGNAVSSAVKYIEDNFGKDISIDTLKSMCHVSESTLRRSFVAYCGLSPMMYLNKVRMSKAYDLLVSTDMSVSEVASSVNIPDLSYFSRRFKATFGISPAVIRKGRV